MAALWGVAVKIDGDETMFRDVITVFIVLANAQSSRPQDEHSLTKIHSFSKINNALHMVLVNIPRGKHQNARKGYSACWLIFFLKYV